MKLGLLSDSHGRSARTRAAVERLRGLGAERLLHLGDVETEAVLDQLAGIPASIVFGNNDDELQLGRYAASLGLKVLHPMGRLELLGQRIGFTHGHIGSCMAAAEREGFHWFFHGHTHRRRDVMAGGTRIVNPGALHRADAFTVAVVDLAAGRVSFEEIPP